MQESTSCQEWRPVHLSKTAMSKQNRSHLKVLEALKFVSRVCMRVASLVYTISIIRCIGTPFFI